MPSPLRAGQRLQIQVEASALYSVTVGPPGLLPSGVGASLCAFRTSCLATEPIATDGTYLLVIVAEDQGVRYTLHTAALPLDVAPGFANLAGKTASDVPGTPLALGTTVVSVVDQDTKRRDVYALPLTAGQTLRVDVGVPSSSASVTLLPPDVASVAASAQGVSLCFLAYPCTATAPIAVSGTYLLVVRAVGSGVQYTLRATASRS